MPRNLEAPDAIDATGKLVLPGGIEAHCHIEQESGMGLMPADDYRTGSISAAFGGNSCFVPFAAQHRGMTIRETLDLYDERSAKSVIDYSYHLIVTDPTELAVTKELPEAFARGVTSFKVFMTYDLTRIDDAQFLDILTVAKAHGALTMVHAENNEMLKWMARRLLDAGHVEPRYHAPSHPGAGRGGGDLPRRHAGEVRRRAAPHRPRLDARRRARSSRTRGTRARRSSARPARNTSS